MYELSGWGATLVCLREEKGYLEGLLSKTATTLNALRERQTRNERTLDSHTLSKHKKKKVLQARWRVNKTIQTCEKEERVILDCLQVCTSNINTLQAMLSPEDQSSMAAEYDSSTSFVGSEQTAFSWAGWTDNSPISPFQKSREGPFATDEVAPETHLEGVEADHVSMAGVNRPLPPRPLALAAPAETMCLVPPNTARTEYLHSALSPEAAVFEPSVTHNAPDDNKGLARELDKLSISGLLASKRMRMIQKRRFSDVAIGHLFRRLSRHTAPQLRAYHSWTSSSTHQKENCEARLCPKRMYSV